MDVVNPQTASVLWVPKASSGWLTSEFQRIVSFATMWEIERNRAGSVSK